MVPSLDSQVSMGSCVIPQCSLRTHVYIIDAVNLPIGIFLRHVSQRDDQVIGVVDVGKYIVSEGSP